MDVLYCSIITVPMAFQSLQIISITIANELGPFARHLVVCITGLVVQGPITCQTSPAKRGADECLR